MKDRAETVAEAGGLDREVSTTTPQQNEEEERVAWPKGLLQGKTTWALFHLLCGLGANDHTCGSFSFQDCKMGLLT